ncbi:MAG: PEP-CTERM sorting domain-containing protein [Pseudomonadota bacterium]
MKNTFIKSLLATAAFVAVSSASAAIITVPTDGTTVTMGATLTGTSTWSLGTDLLDASLDMLRPGLVLGNTGAATISIAMDEGRDFFTAVSISSPMTSLQVDTTSAQLLTTSSTGGISFAMKALKHLSTGGSLAVTDLDIDLFNKKVYANIVGGNDVGTLNHVYLWDIANITTDAGPNYVHSELTDLSMTTEGLNIFSQSLGLTPLMQDRMTWVNSGGFFGGRYGSISITIVATPAVPEPATIAYLLGGLAIVGMILRRRAK